MSIASVGGSGAITLGSLLSPFLPQLDGAQSTSSTSVSTACAASSVPSGTSSSTGSTNNLTGSGKGELSSEILALLIQMQQMVDGSQSETGSTGSSSTNGTVSSNGTTAAATTSTTHSTTMANPIASLFSAMGGTAGGTVSESDFESYIEKLGGTQSQADQLYSQLTRGSSAGLTEQQLAQDVFGSAPQGPPPSPSPEQMADGLINAMGGSNGSVSKSEFENFVTSNGGTTSEADQDFAALDTSSSGSLTTSDLEQALEKTQSSNSQTASSTTISPILAWLDALSATASGTPTV
jgi:hypothetical protein